MAGFTKNIGLLILLVVVGFSLLSSDVLAQSARQRMSEAKSSIQENYSGVGSFQGRVDRDSMNLDEEFMDLSSIRPGVGGVAGALTQTLYYNVHVLGELNRPGIYKILPSDRLSDVVKYAGGANVNGSRRFVHLRRNNQTKVYDIDAYKKKGVLSQNPYLMENDVVFVPLRAGQIQIEGPVRSPGYYEINKPLTLIDVISMAGGFSEGLSVDEPIRVIRFEDGHKSILEVNNDSDGRKNFLVNKGDIIVIPHLLLSEKKFDYNVKRIPGDNIFYPTINDNVYVIGSVALPGPYPFEPSYKYLDYISQAGPTNLASIKRSKIIMSSGEKKYARKTGEINAGDTIVVPGKSITATNVITWFNTLSNMALTSFVFYDRFVKP